MKGKEEPAADGRPLMMKSCVQWASMDLLMKAKREHAFPSLALISPLSGGSAVNATRRRPDGRRRTTDGKKTGKQKECGGSKVFKLCCQCLHVKINQNSRTLHIYMADLFLKKSLMNENSIHIFTYFYKCVYMNPRIVV